MSNKSTNVLKSKPVRKLQSLEKPRTVTSLYSGIQNAERAIQQQRSTQSRRPVQSKHGLERTTTYATINGNLPANYHPWKPEYHKIITREKNIKSMTKDPYTLLTRLIDHAIELITTEEECSPTLISGKAVKIEKFNIRQPPPRPLMPTIVRYLRRNELLPSERSALSNPMNKPLLTQLPYEKSTISVMNTSKINDIPPTLPRTHRLLNRAKMQNNELGIRRPPRQLHINVSHETIMPLTVYG